MEIITTNNPQITLTAIEDVTNINIVEEVININIVEEVINISNPIGGYPTPSTVYSVFGRTGAVVGQLGDYTTSIIGEGSNLYFTQSRARAAINSGSGISYNPTSGVISSTITQYTDALARLSISLTKNGSSGEASYDNTTGVLNVPNYTLSGLGGQPLLNGNGFVKANGSTITYDNSTYLTNITSALVIGALGFTPYNATNPSGYITGISFADVSDKPNTLSGYGITDAVPSLRTITINGDTKDLSANRSWSITSLKTWWDFIIGKSAYIEIPVSGGVIYELSYTGTTEKRYRFVGNPYSDATDIIYTTYSGGVLSNPVAYKLITL